MQEEIHEVAQEQAPLSLIEEQVSHELSNEVLDILPSIEVEEEGGEK
jgi:hypothetical protein